MPDKRQYVWKLTTLIHLRVYQVLLFFIKGLQLASSILVVISWFLSQVDESLVCRPAKLVAFHLHWHFTLIILRIWKTIEESSLINRVEMMIIFCLIHMAVLDPNSSVTEILPPYSIGNRINQCNYNLT